MVSSNLNIRLRLAKARKSVDNGSELSGGFVPLDLKLREIMLHL